MKKIIYLLLFILMNQFSIYAQNGFRKGLDLSLMNWGYHVVQSKDGNLLISGASSGNGYLFLAKLTLTGDTLWQRRLNSSLMYPSKNICATSDSGCVIAATTLNSSTNKYEYYLMKIDKNGDKKWAKSFTGNYNVNTCLVETSDKGLLMVTSYNEAYNSFYEDAMVLIRTDNNGNLKWSKAFRNAAGGNYQPGDMQLDAAGNAYIITTCGTDTSSYNLDGLLIKVDTAGTLLFMKSYTSAKSVVPFSIRISGDGSHLYITGYYSDSISRNYSMLMKTDLAGNPLWSKAYSVNSYGRAYNMEILSDDEMVMTGLELLTKVDSSGNVSWTRKFAETSGGIIHLWGLVHTSDNGFFLSGLKNNSGAMNVYMVKTDANGLTGCSNDSSVVTITATPVINMQSLIAQVMTAPVVSTLDPALSNLSPALVTYCSTINSSEILHGKDNELLIYPVPVTNRSEVKMHRTLNKGEFNLYNMNGQVTHRLNNINGDYFTFDRGNAISGIYFYTISENGVLIYKGKISVK